MIFKRIKILSYLSLSQEDNGFLIHSNLACNHLRIQDFQAGLQHILDNLLRTLSNLEVIQDNLVIHNNLAIHNNLVIQEVIQDNLAIQEAIHNNLAIQGVIRGNLVFQEVILEGTDRTLSNHSVGMYGGLSLVCLLQLT